MQFSLRQFFLHNVKEQHDNSDGDI